MTRGFIGKVVRIGLGLALVAVFATVNTGCASNNTGCRQAKSSKCAGCPKAGCKDGKGCCKKVAGKKCDKNCTKDCCKKAGCSKVAGKKGGCPKAAGKKCGKDCTKPCCQKADGKKTDGKKTEGKSAEGKK